MSADGTSTGGTGTGGAGVTGSWEAALAGEANLEPALVRELVGLAVSGRAGPSRQRRVMLARLARTGQAAPRDVVADLCRAVALPDPAAVDRAGQRLVAMHATVAFAGARGYPERLWQLWPELGPPLAVFRVAAGPLPPGPSVAVVGSRQPSLDGLDLAGELARLLARHGIVVVSGMARGIDEAAHEGALSVGGTTIAVLGTGFGVDYPRGRGPLRVAIAASGGVITELAPGAPPLGFQFLDRNRIVSGLADAIVVVEGRARSGALATARIGAEQGREVWAIPGSPNQPTSRAPLDLIRDGARPLTRLDDVLEVLQTYGVTASPSVGAGAAAVRAADPAIDRAAGRAQVQRGDPGEDQGEDRFGDRSAGPRVDSAHAQLAANFDTATGTAAAAAVPDGPLSAVLAGLSAVPANAAALAHLTGMNVGQVLAALAELTANGHARTTPQGWICGGRP